MDLKDEVGREYIGEYGRRREKGEMQLDYYLKNKQQKAFFHVSLQVCLLSMSLKYPTPKKFRVSCKAPTTLFLEKSIHVTVGRV